MSSEQQIDAQTIEQTKAQIRGLVNEIAQLAKTDIGPEEFYAHFTQRIVSALAAVGGAVWILGENRRPELAYQISISDTLLDPTSDDAKRHQQLLNYVVARNEPILQPPLSGAGDEHSGGNPTRYLLVLAPLRSEGKVEGVVEIFQRPDSAPATQRGYLKFLLQMCELAGEWLKSRKLRQFSDRHTLWEQADQFSRLVHDSLDMREVSYTVANEGRRLIGCDRVSVAISKGSTCHIEAISGQDTLENRSNIVHLLSQLASRVVATGEPLWYDGVTDDLPPQVESALEDYVDESYTQSMVVLPLRKPKQFYEVNEQESARSEAEVEDNTSREIFGALIVEQIESNVPRGLLEPRVDLVYEHSARALANSMEQHNLFLMPLWKTLGRSRWLIAARTLPKTLAVAIGVLALLIVLIVVPIPFNMQANGTLEPVAKREVFAQLNGVVSTVYKDHGDQVAAGEVLLELRNPDLSVESEQLNGQIASALQRISSIDKTLIEGGERLSEDQRVQLSGERAQLQAQLTSLNKQRDLVDDKIDMLKICAPIAGQVISWNVAKNLENRPVQPGMVLMTIAD
ncbi:MAG: hypothetical protein ACI9HK_006174, partial [Pirellulaceae bacterium]